MNAKQEATYRAYLLRLWRSDPDEPWRVTLVNTVSGEQVHFPDLESLCTYLSQQNSQQNSTRGLS